MENKSKWEGHARLIAYEKAKMGDEKKHEEFTPELQARRTNRSDKPFIPRSYHFNSEASKDGIKHFAEGIGDNNPLFQNEEYAKKTKYGKIIAPGSYLYSIMWETPGFGGPGIHGWYSGGDWEWYRPIQVGDKFKVVCCLREFVSKQGKMGGGRTWVDYNNTIYVNQKGEIVGKEYGHEVFAERSRSGEAGKYRSIPRPVYGREDWIRILDLYDKEEVRGAKPRYWEDVQVGDKLGPMIKGPLSVRDLLAWLMGCGSPYFKAHKSEYEYERRHPRILLYTESGEADIPGDVPELVHVLNTYAQAIGVERAYDYGCQRMAWLCNFFTNWIGDDGFLWKMSGDLRAFNIIGDITTFEGKVIKKYIEEGKCCVDIEAWAKNQREQWSITPHTSTVILPSKEYGAVIYPEPPSDIAQMVTRARPLDDMIKDKTLV